MSTLTPAVTPQLNAKRRLLVVLALGLIPWALISIPTTNTLTFVLPFGLIDATSGRLLALPTYLSHVGGRIAPLIQAWPVGVLLYVCALLSAIGGVFGHEDPRLTGGFLVLTAVSQLPFVLGFSRRFGYTTIPVGSILMLAAAWWLYWPMATDASE